MLYMWGWSVLNVLPVESHGAVAILAAIVRSAILNGIKYRNLDPLPPFRAVPDELFFDFTLVHPIRSSVTHAALLGDQAQEVRTATGVRHSRNSILYLPQKLWTTSGIDHATRTPLIFSEESGRFLSAQSSARYLIT